MTQPTPVAPKPTTNMNMILRAVVSVLETLAFIIASTLAIMDNGSDFKHAIVTALIGFIMHGVNHNAGGSPV